MLQFIQFPDWINPEIIRGLPIRWYGLMYLVAFAITYLLFILQIKSGLVKMPVPDKIEPDIFERDILGKTSGDEDKQFLRNLYPESPSRRMRILKQGISHEDESRVKGLLKDLRFVNQTLVVNLFFWGIVGLLIGARLFATLLFDSTHYYLQHPWLIFWPFGKGFQFIGFQGMNYYGGVAGAIVAILIYCRIKKINVLSWGDALCAGIPLGYTFGRIGNFINAELFGRVTAAPWGMMFPQGDPLSIKEPWVAEMAKRVGLEIPEGAKMINLPRHPTQLYEAFFEGIALWLALWFFFRKRKPYGGFIIGCYIIGYGLIRFVVDYFRLPFANHYLGQPAYAADSIHRLVSPFNLISAQVYDILMIAGGVIFLVVRAQLSKKEASLLQVSEERQKTSTRKLHKKLGKK